ncbi:uncharacterized protein [Miscanthus floridulus]|uniref:uncharacterized protein n=1 Tax=Miscanthus floridulus TaxID=154761 RepID=UPI00345979C2
MSRDEEIMRKLFVELNREAIGIPRDGGLVILSSNSKEEIIEEEEVDEEKEEVKDEPMGSGRRRQLQATPPPARVAPCRSPTLPPPVDAGSASRIPPAPRDTDQPPPPPAPGHPASRARHAVPQPGAAPAPPIRLPSTPGRRPASRLRRAATPVARLSPPPSSRGVKQARPVAVPGFPTDLSSFRAGKMVSSHLSVYSMVRILHM